MGTEQEYGTLYWNGQPIGELSVKTMTIGDLETIKLKPLKWYQKIYYFGIIRAYCFITAKIKAIMQNNG